MAQRKKKSPMIEALRSSETVNVTAKRPDNSVPYPENIDEIYLGTRDKLPTGTYTPPAKHKPILPEDSPMLASILSFLNERPAMSNMINMFQSREQDKDIGGEAVPSFDQSYIVLNPNYPNWNESLYHEAAHAAQRTQFPDSKDYAQYGLMGRKDWDTYAPKTYQEYRNIPGEHLAHAVAEAALKRRKRLK